MRVAGNRNTVPCFSSVGTIDTNMKGKSSTVYIMHISLSDFQELYVVVTAKELGLDFLPLSRRYGRHVTQPVNN